MQSPLFYGLRTSMATVKRADGAAPGGRPLGVVPVRAVPVGAVPVRAVPVRAVPAQEALADRKDANASSMTARPAPSLARDALLFGQGFRRLGR